MSAYRFWLFSVMRQLEEVLSALELVQVELTRLRRIIDKRPGVNLRLSQKGRAMLFQEKSFMDRAVAGEFADPAKAIAH